jgi:ATP phosphoribosyltransferase regulatory subunit
VILPIPSGTRDVLPDEMRELRAVLDALRGAFAAHGYGEVATPALEYERVLDRAGLGARPAYRVVDDHGEVLVLRTDMTVPIARVVASRFAAAEPPLRLCYVAPVYRTVRPLRGAAREFLQAGIELVGAPSPEGTAEALTVLCHALEATGLRDFRIGVGSAAILPGLLRALEVPEEAWSGVQAALAAGDFVALEAEVGALRLDDGDAELVLRTARARGGPEVLDEAEGPLAAAVRGLRSVHARLPDHVAARLVFDLGLVRELGYYTGAVFEVYDPAFGEPLGGGGRYDDLLGRFGRALPAVGFALRIDSLHAALTAEERTPRGAFAEPVA